jgi:DNA-binding XRE family transcriptional regulator
VEIANSGHVYRIFLLDILSSLEFWPRRLIQLSDTQRGKRPGEVGHEMGPRAVLFETPTAIMVTSIQNLCQLLTIQTRFCGKHTLTALTLARPKLYFPLMTDFDEVYRVLGRKVRQTREVQRMSQDLLAQHLGISRASMVNIEAGRQRAPLHLLWQIAEVLHCKLIELIPTPDEVAVRPNQPLLDREVIDQIEEVANGDPATVKLLTGFITKTVKAVNTSATEGKPHAKAKSRRKS